MRKTQVTMKDGSRQLLYTDDTLTLAFAGLIESSPASLRCMVCERSLRRIMQQSPDDNERSKAERALKIK